MSRDVLVHTCSFPSRLSHLPRQPLRRLARGTLLVAFALALLVAAGLVASERAYAEPQDFLLLSDTHLGLPGSDTYSETEEALLWATEKLPDLAAVCVAGDVTDRGAADSYSEWEFLCDSIAPHAARIQALGDHDTGKYGAYLKADPRLTAAYGYRRFKAVNGGAATSFTQFDRVNVMTVGGVRARGYSTITAGMLKRLDARLKKTARQGKMAVVICHYPYDSSALSLRKRLMGVLRSYPNVIYVSGHRHRYTARQQCQSVAPSCTTTPYARAGASRTAKFTFRSIGVNACSSYRSGGAIYADTLHVADDGAFVLRKWNVGKDRLDKAWKFSQPKSSVKVKAQAASRGDSENTPFTYRITFSDGGTYGGVKSGETFALAPGASKTFSRIPAGVLVTVKAADVPQGWSQPKTQRVEVGKTAKLIAMASRFSLTDRTAKLTATR